MCLDCGCNRPDDQHDDSRHITTQTIRDAAEASGISQDEVVSNIFRSWEHVTEDQKEA